MFTVISSHLPSFIYKHVSILSIGSDGPISEEPILYWESRESLDTLSIIWKVFWERVSTDCCGSLEEDYLNFRNWS